MATPATVLAIVRAARPVFRQRADALAFALHAALLAEGFVLVAAGATAEDEPSADAALHEAGPDGWDASPDEYAFRYRQESAGSGTVVLKALAASGKLFVDAAGSTPAAEATHLELRRVVPSSSPPAPRERALTSQPGATVSTTTRRTSSAAATPRCIPTSRVCSRASAPRCCQR
jgi:proteasome inhibitor subunit 1 (PI31)